MRKHIPSLLATIIASVLHSQQGLATDLATQCMLGVPSFDRPFVERRPGDLPMTINAGHAKGSYPNNAAFTDNVDTNQGSSRLRANEVQLHQQQAAGQTQPVRAVDALGNVHYDDNQVILKGPKAWSNLNTKDTNVWQGDYQMVGCQGRGTADLMKQRGENRYTILENGSFTSRLPDSDTWSVVGSEVIHNREEQVAETWNVRFKLGSVPIFHSPYLQLPVGDERRSGLLIPNAKYSTKNDVEFSLPYYWNIAPNFDVTITPHYMNKRGGMTWENEFRYLTQLGSGSAEFDYLPSDKVYEDDHSSDSNSRRWLFYWSHSGAIDQVWCLNADYTKVSDLDYFDDFSSEYGSSIDGYATQKFSAGYANQDFGATVSTKQFQVSDRELSNSCSAEPQLDINYYQSDVDLFDTHLYGQVAHFVNSNNNMPEATRVHLGPTINLLLSNAWGSLSTEAKLLVTHYQQSNLDKYNAANSTDYKESVNRVMPQFKVDGKMVFEYDLQEGFTQTLEPRMQYLCVPYHDQSEVSSYDSTLLQSDYIGLFRDRTYSGLDRIASANQVTTGTISYMYGVAAVERFNTSVGQIYYFTESRTGDDNINWENNGTTGSLVWAGDTYWRIADDWGLREGIQYDTRLDNVATGDGTIEYRRGESRLVQLNYRYISPEYTQATLPSYSTAAQYKQGISQAGMTASWPIVNHWSVAGAYYFDTNTRKAANQMSGVQYNSYYCAIRLGYERKVNGWDNSNNGGESKHDNTFGINIELRGLNSNYGLGTQQMLRSNALPYQNSL